jgi:predicted ATPase
MTYNYNQRPSTTVPESVLKELKGKTYAALIGKNNCGKSYILKTLAIQLGRIAKFIGPSRFGTVYVLANHDPSNAFRENERNQFSNSFHNVTQNNENQHFDLSQGISALSNQQRDVLIKLVRELLGQEIEIKLTTEGNDMSQRYMAVNGHNLSFTSAGFRMLISIITALLDDTCSHFFIDEPELGISPEAQARLFDIITDTDVRAKCFPHIKTLAVATHSTVFLDRNCISNNYIITKDGDNIKGKKIESFQEIHDAHFFLLGNKIDQLYLPSAILYVEGKTDYKFIKKVISSMNSKNTISVICTDGDGKMKESLYSLKQFLGDLQKSPFKSRIFCILDERHEKTIPKQLENMGIDANGIIVWDKNGIEYYYPQSVIDEAFGSDTFEINGDVISANKISKSKDELCEYVVQKINSETIYNNEFNEKFLNKIKSFI